MTNHQLSTWHVRWMIRRDLPEVVAIDRLAGRRWDGDRFIATMAKRHVIGMVADLLDDPNPVVGGFMVYELREASLHVLSFALHPEWCAESVGGSLIAKLKSKLSSHRRTFCTVDVPEQKDWTQVFLASHGFEATGILKRKSGDVYRMRFRVSEES